MDATRVGWQLAVARADAGFTQIEVAERMATTQSSISRAESGRVLPSIAFVERYAKAIGRPIQLTVGATASTSTSSERRARVRDVLGDYVFDPWKRDPSPAEARTLEADGLTRERFERREAARRGRD